MQRQDTFHDRGKFKYDSITWAQKIRKEERLTEWMVTWDENILCLHVNNLEVN